MDTEAPLPPFILAFQARVDALEKDVTALNLYRIYREIYDEEKAWELAIQPAKESPE